MKVAIVINTSWNIYNFRLGLVYALLENNYEVLAIAPKDKYSDRLVQLGCQFVEVAMDSQGVNPIKDIILTYRLYKVYKRYQPDITLHFTIKPNIYGAIAGRLTGIKSINNVSGLGTVFLKDNMLSWISKKLYKFSFKFPVKVFFQNQDDQKLFLDEQLVLEDITEVIPGSGINLKNFKPGQAVSNHKFSFLLISRIIKDKGVREFIDAIKILHKKNIQVHFSILGPKDPEHKRGIAISEIDSWIEDGLIDYLGITDDVRPFIEQTDCVVLPSYREGTPRTLLEAASMGKPLIATDVAGCREVVRHQINGMLCQVKNAADLADKMERMINLNKNELHKMGIESRKLVEEKFDENIVINKYLNILKMHQLDTLNLLQTYEG